MEQPEAARSAGKLSLLKPATLRYGPKAMPGLRRHATHLPRSDGTTNGKLVEVKTISPEKSSDVVLVKRQGDFRQLLIVRIDQDFQFKSKLLDRSELKGADGRFLRGRLKDEEPHGVAPA